MSKITKLLVMLLALVMVVSVFAGCTPNVTPPEQTTAPSQPTEENKQTGVTTPIDNEMFPLSKPVTFRIGIRGQKEYQSLIERCEWYRYLCEKTNVFLECVVLGDDYMDTLNALISTNFTPDVILGPDTLSSAQIVDLAGQDKLLYVENFVTDANVMPNYQRALQAVPGALSKMTSPDGHIWSLIGFSEASGTAWESPLTVNIEWLKKVPGYENGNTFPKTVEEFTEVLRYFKKNDMNGNGDANDEIPLLMVSSSDNGDGLGTLQGLMNLWGLSTTDSYDEYYVHVQDDGVCSLAPQTQNYRDCLNWVSVWWQEGLLWDKFFDDVSAEEFAAVAGAETASWGFYNGGTWFNNGSEDNGNLAWRDAQTLVVPFSTGYDVRYNQDSAILGNLNTFTIFKNCKNPKVLLAWLDQFFSLTGTQSASSGMANEWERWDDADAYKAYYDKNPTWYIEQDGSVKYPSQNAGWVDMNTFDATMATKKETNHPVWANIFNQNDIFKCITPEMYLNGQWPVDAESEAYVLGKFMQENPTLFDHKIWPSPYYTENEKGELDFLFDDIKLISAKYEEAFIKGELRLNDGNWAQFQQELELAGVKDLVATLQSVWNRFAG